MQTHTFPSKHSYLVTLTVFVVAIYFEVSHIAAGKGMNVPSLPGFKMLHQVGEQNFSQIKPSSDLSLGYLGKTTQKGSRTINDCERTGALRRKKNTSDTGSLQNV